MNTSKEQLYYDYLGRRAAEGMRLRAKEGFLTGPAPLGYCKRYINGKSEVVLDKENSHLIQLAFELVGLKGLTLRKALLVVSNQGLLSKRGSALSYSSFQGMMTNPFYCGYIRFNGELLQGKHEPLISRELFGMVQGRLRERQNCRNEPSL